MKYDVKITGLGDMALEFLNPGMEMQFVILFNDNAPAELGELEAVGATYIAETVEEMQKMLLNL